MKIEFKRSGGLAFITSVAAGASLEGDTGEVKSNDGKYVRALSTEEAQELRAEENPQAPSRDSGDSPSDNADLLDGFHYTITVTDSRGQRHTWNINAGSRDELGKLPPAAARLLRWVEEEADRILQHRATAP